MKRLFKYLAVVTALAWCVASAYAVPTLTIFDGITTITVTDNSLVPLDSDGTLGSVTWIGTIGVWNVNVDTGLTKPVIGSPVSPALDLSFLAHSTGAGTLTLTFSDDGFTASGGIKDVIGGTQSNGSVNDLVYKNGGIVASILGLVGSPFSGATGGFVTLLPTDVFAIQVVITHTAAGTTTGNKDVSVPDGGMTIVLLGSSLAALGLFGRSRKYFAKA